MNLHIMSNMSDPKRQALDAGPDLDTTTLAGEWNSFFYYCHVLFQYDMSNRAQLPCGIENIRPHLDTMDNVPLLVSLFTDSSPGSQ